MRHFFSLIASSILLFSCNNSENISETTPIDLSSYFSIDFNNLPNYANQSIPNYITKNNTPANNPITDNGATLGRILFYDNNLSSNNSVSCASCHKQELAFSDNNILSLGANDFAARHTMRLVNTRFSNETNFFWDERAASLEEQTTLPIQNHNEMGFSGENGDQNFNDLIEKLNNVEYYPTLFSIVFGDETITETRIQNAISQFIRSIQSFDSKFDIGRTQATNDAQPFANYTNTENIGKNLFLSPPIFNNQGSRISGGIGCAGCHQAPEFNIKPNSRNNGVIGNANGNGVDISITRAPSLRDVVKSNGESNGPFMHIGISENLITVLNHYDNINLAGNTNLDPILRPNGFGQQLNMTNEEKNAVIAFIRTLAGSNIYTDEKWSDPFIN